MTADGVMPVADAAFSPVCSIHPERAGVALCVSCRRTVCAECTTRLRGINYCSACIPALARAAAAVRPTSPAAELAGVVLVYLAFASLIYAVAALLAP